MAKVIIIPTEQEGLILRELATPADDWPYFDSYNASREEIKVFDPEAETRYRTIGQVRRSRIDARITGKLRLGIWDEETFVGSINLTPDEQGAEIGYWCDSRHKGHGYTTMATRALANYAAERYPVVHANVVEGNNACVRVLERAGFIQTAHEVGKLAFILAVAE